jgi:hypothetical protein
MAEEKKEDKPKKKKAKKKKAEVKIRACLNVERYGTSLC